MRPSKNQHVVAMLREKLGETLQKNGLPITQANFAASVGAKRRTIQDIELGVRDISVPLADKISRRWNVSMTSLRQNDLKGGLRNRDGKPWTVPPSPDSQPKTNSQLAQKISWEALSESALHSRVITTQMLLGQFQDLRDYFEHAVTDQPEARIQWQLLFYLCFHALDRLQTEGTYHRQHYEDPVEATLGELHQLSKTLRTSSKRAKSLESRTDVKASEYWRTLLADRYGWDERGLEAYELWSDREGKGKETLERDPAEFDRMLNERLKEKGLRPLHRDVTFKECFGAIKAVYQEDFQRQEATNA